MPADLQTFYQDHSWFHRFDEHILAQGKKLSSPTRLTSLHLEPVEDGYLLTATSEGHNVEINLWPETETHWEYDTSCSCDYGPHCPHAAAALLRSAKPNTLSRLLRGGGFSANTPAQKKPPITPAPQTEAHPAHFHLSLSEEPATSRVTQLLLQALKSPNRTTWLVARPTVRYGDEEIPLIKTSSHPHLLRDKPAEFRALELLTQLGLTNLHSNPTYRFLLSFTKKQSNEPSPAEGAWFPEPHGWTPAVFWPWFRAKAIPRLQEAGWTVEIDPNFGHHLHTLQDDQLEASLELAPGGWFTLSVGIDLAGRKLDLLPVLIKLLDSDTLDQLNDLDDDDPHLVYLPDSHGGGALEVPAGRLRLILHHLAALTDPKEPSLHPLDAAALAEDEALPIDPPPALKKLRRQISSSKSQIQKFVAPDGLQATLRPYQQAGVEWMQTLSHNELNGILADDMGLGKTIQTLTHILNIQQDGQKIPTLIVAPTSVVPNWLAEVRKFTPSLKPLVLQGSKRRRLFSHIKHADIVITSFALLQRDIEELKKHHFRLIVLDEAQHIKNPSAKVTQAACQLRGTQRFCLSGTPVENNLGELWSLMRFLIPGLLGSREKFRAHYQTPIEKEDCEERREALRKRLAPLILRRTKDQVAKDLPPKTILTHSIDLTSHQRDLYETVRATMDKRVREAIEAQGLEQSQFAILDALLKLRQICCHPTLLKLPQAQKSKDKQSAKLNYLFDLLDTLFAEKRRVLLFSQFTSMLELIETELRVRRVSYLKLTGASKDRGGMVEQFQNSTIPIFLISLKAGGTGLNLTAADTVIHYDPWWNPAAENQATDRAYRIGQDKPVFVHKLICQGTVEDRINQLQQKKAHLADSLLSGASQGAPDAETLRSLLDPVDEQTPESPTPEA